MLRNKEVRKSGVFFMALMSHQTRNPSVSSSILQFWVADEADGKFSLRAHPGRS